MEDHEVRHQEEEKAVIRRKAVGVDLWDSDWKDEGEAERTTEGIGGARGFVGYAWER